MSQQNSTFPLRLPASIKAEAERLAAEDGIQDEDRCPIPKP
jgi:hypothetical protein